MPLWNPEKESSEVRVALMAAILANGIIRDSGEAEPKDVAKGAVRMARLIEEEVRATEPEEAA